MESKESLIIKVKNICNITWEDESINKKIDSMIEDAEIALNHKLGATIDYSVKGMERRLFLNI